MSTFQWQMKCMQNIRAAMYAVYARLSPLFYPLMVYGGKILARVCREKGVHFALP